DEVGGGGLCRAGGAYECHLLAGLGVQRNIVQHRLFGGVAEVHVVEADVAPQAGVGDGAVVVGVLPGPDVGPLGVFLEGAVGVLPGVDQGDVAVVGLGLFVQQGEDAVGAGQAHVSHADLVGHLADGAGKLLGQDRKSVV